MFEITVRTSFSARHALRNYRGTDEAPHAHRFACEVSIASGELDASGCAIDFAEVDAALARTLSPLADRQLCETAPFLKESPSAENIARYLFHALAESCANKARRVVRVTVWEDELHSASYYE